LFSRKLLSKERMELHGAVAATCNAPQAHCN
jgi:hypothetical protein